MKNYLKNFQTVAGTFFLIFVMATSCGSKKKQTNQLNNNEVSGNVHSVSPSVEDGTFSLGLENLGSSCYMNSMISFFANYSIVNDENIKYLTPTLTNESNINFTRRWFKAVNIIRGNPSPTVLNEQIEKISHIIDYKHNQDDPSVTILQKMEFPNSEKIYVVDISLRNFDSDISSDKRVVIDPFDASQSVAGFNFIPVNPIGDDLRKSLDLDYLVTDFEVAQENPIFKLYKTRRFTLNPETKRAPEKIIFQLNRFEMLGISDSGTIISKKINNKVYPNPNMELSFTNDAGEIRKEDYQVSAIIIHLGSTPSSGHYISYIRHADNKWYVHDDSTVLETVDYQLKYSANMEDIIEKNGYIFLYKKSH